MFIGIWISPVAVAAAVAAVLLGVRAPWWALAVVAACAVLAVAAVVRLMRAAERRGAMATAQWSVQRQLRAEAVAREVPAGLPPAGAPAIGPVYHFNFYGPAGDTHAAIIRKAITGPAGDATTEGK
jgi:hypothetical protein